ncbi:hypothetical protein [Bryobacter aggregatus]|uniref:hypothetical protein n=1 Tax=Bryobacter aggregatus TaxID=360054 RepID=UPI0004E1D7B7|nr:hypothetical protein [Bryobacter aggregatus]
MAAQSTESNAILENLEAKLRADCQPGSALEEQAFQRYVWANYQCERVRILETLTEERWLANADAPQYLSALERIAKIAALHERRADRALRQLRLLQQDRFAAYEVQAELTLLGQDAPIPKSLPITEIRKSNLQRTNPNYLAQFLLYQTEEVKQIADEMLRNAKANPMPPQSVDDLLQWAKDQGL